ncbi:DUF4376 domain-containing protein [Stutzerimonas nitrititolerans]|uniref:DUF4376 domain-containing protein n=1 Tax=Stutzerimonas nitrititolerans TaxID=2482751 RepID=UPI002897784B|nr:hypothetical protein [Stutzerimonas nitrititolerans]
MYTYIIDNLQILTGPVELPVIPGIGVQLPSNAVDLPAPLPVPSDGSVWALVEGRPQQLEYYPGNYHDTTTGAAVQWDQLGPLPDNLTDVPSPSSYHRWKDGQWRLDPPAVHTFKVRAINQACEAAITAGFTSDALGAPHFYSSQLDDQLNLTGAVLRGLDMPYACRDAQGVKAFRLHTAEQLRQVGDDFTLYKLQLLQHANDLKQQLDAALEAGDLAALEAVTWEAPQP